MSTVHPTFASPPAAGWYPEPQTPGQERYWDGATWTEHVRPAAGPLMTVAPAYAPAYAPVAPAAKAGNTMSIIAIVLGALAVLLLPPVLGTIGVVLGILAKRRGESLSTWALVVPLVGMFLGMGLGVMLALGGLI